MDISENESEHSCKQKHFIRDVLFHGKFHVSVACFSVSLRKPVDVDVSLTSYVSTSPFHRQFDNCSFSTAGIQDFCTNVSQV